MPKGKKKGSKENRWQSREGNATLKKTSKEELLPDPSR